MAMKNTLKQPEKNAQRDPGKRDGLVVTMERKGISSRIALRHLSRPWIHLWSAKDHTGREIALRLRSPGLDSQDNQD